MLFIFSRKKKNTRLSQEFLAFLAFMLDIVDILFRRNIRFHEFSHYIIAKFHASFSHFLVKYHNSLPRIIRFALVLSTIRVSASAIM